jgi:hypothetical protein
MSPRRKPRVRFFDYEHRSEPVAPPHVFRRRMLQSGFIALIVIGFSLAMGMAGYHWLGHIESWVDCLYNASMILGGMGPVAELTDVGGKVFASFYALYSGIALLASVGVLLSPALHRLLHAFHVETDEDGAA